MPAAANAGGGGQAAPRSLRTDLEKAKLRASEQGSRAAALETEVQSLQKLSKRHLYFMTNPTLEAPTLSSNPITVLV